MIRLPSANSSTVVVTLRLAASTGGERRINVVAGRSSLNKPIVWRGLHMHHGCITMGQLRQYSNTEIRTTFPILDQIQSLSGMKQNLFVKIGMCSEIRFSFWISIIIFSYLYLKNIYCYIWTYINTLSRSTTYIQNHIIL